VFYFQKKKKIPKISAKGPPMSDNFTGALSSARATLTTLFQEEGILRQYLYICHPSSAMISNLNPTVWYYKDHPMLSLNLGEVRATLTANGFCMDGSTRHPCFG
jgi:hypothetical protein